MPRRSRKRQKATLRYPKYAVKPEDLLHFIELEGFEDDWKRLGLDDEALFALELAIMAGGKGSPIIRGTGGLRKLRFAPDTWDVGKSSGVRVCFAYFEKHFLVLLIVAYSKSERDNLSAAAKNLYRKMLKEAERELEKTGTIQ